MTVTEKIAGTALRQGVKIAGTEVTLDSLFSGGAAASTTASGVPVRVISQGGVPRWVLPENARRAVPVLKSWGPFSAKSRLKWSAVLTLCRLNALTALPGVTRESLSCDLSYWRRNILDFSDSWAMVAYIGNPFPTRKALLFFIDEGAQVRAVAKVPIYPAAKAAILNEANILSKLQDRLPLPRVLFSDEKEGIAAQSWMEGTNVSRTFGAEHLELLTSFASRSTTVRISDCRDQLEQRLARLCPIADTSLLQRALLLLDVKEKLRACVEHGDFTPWNLRRLKDGRLTLIDWEWAVDEGLPWQDVCRYFYLQDYLFGESANVWEILTTTPLLMEYCRRFELSSDAVRGLTLRFLLRFLCDEHEDGNRQRVEYAAEKIREIVK